MDCDSGRPEGHDGLPELKVRRWSNYPAPGIDFPDASTFTCDGALAAVAFRELERCLPGEVDLVAGIDVGGIGFAGALALARGIGFIDIRKVGSLRPDVVRYVIPNYELGSGVALSKGNQLAERSIAVIDDCLMSGSTGARLDPVAAPARRALHDRPLRHRARRAGRPCGAGSGRHCCPRAEDAPTHAIRTINCLTIRAA